jgi:hypothetical protein
MRDGPAGKGGGRENATMTWAVGANRGEPASSRRDVSTCVGAAATQISGGRDVPPDRAEASILGNSLGDGSAGAVGNPPERLERIARDVVRFVHNRLRSGRLADRRTCPGVWRDEEEGQVGQGGNQLKNARSTPRRGGAKSWEKVAPQPLHVHNIAASSCGATRKPCRYRTSPIAAQFLWPNVSVPTPTQV